MRRPAERTSVLGRVITCVGDEVIEDGFVHLKERQDRRRGQARPMRTIRRSIRLDTHGKDPDARHDEQPRAPLSWDGIHELSQQSMFDAPEIRAYKAAGNMIKSPAGRASRWSATSGVHNANLFTKQAVAQGIFPGPRLLVSGRKASSRPAATPIGFAARPPAPTRCAAPCVIRSKARGRSDQDYGVPRHAGIHRRRAARPH